MGYVGVGVKVAELLQQRDLGPDISVVCCGTDGMALSHHFVGADTVLVVDAIAVDDTPGSVFRFTAEDIGLVALRSHTSHGLSLPNIMLAARLQGANPDVIIYAVQIGSITCGFDTLTDDVSAAVPDVAEMVAAEATQLASQQSECA
jgi:hydrogenase maturation protease